MKYTILILSLFFSLSLSGQHMMLAGGAEAAAPPVGNEDFRIVVNTANTGVSLSDQFQFTGAVGDYDVHVYDETGTTKLEEITGLSDAATITIGAGAGIYELRVFPAAVNGFNRLVFNSIGDKLKLVEIRNWGSNVVWTSCEAAYYGCANLTSISSNSTFNTASVTSFANFARECTSLTTLDVSGWNTAGVTSFVNFAFNCRSLTTLDVSGWNTASVTSFANFAYNCQSLTSLDVSGWNTASVTSFFNFAFSCRSLTTLDVSGWNTAGVTNFTNFASSCQSLTSLDVSGWNTASVTNFANFARGCRSLTTLDVSGWNTASVTSFANFARGCTSLTSLDVSGWNVSNVTDFFYFLQGAAINTSSYDQLLISFEAQGPLTGLNFHGGSSTYTLGGAAEAARTSLINTYGWTITDGGGI